MRAIDPIDRIALMEKLGIGKECTVCEQNSDPYCKWKPDVVDVCEAICTAPTIEPEPRWIPFKRRKPTEEEGTAFDYIMDCKCPEDGQNILVSINIQGHEHVQYDTYYGGGGEECCLESGYELVEEATAWMPLPEAYREEGD